MEISFVLYVLVKKKEKRAKVVALGAKGVAPTTAVFHGELRNYGRVPKNEETYQSGPNRKCKLCKPEPKVQAL